jgi:viroplasmin and RNaseH domain-containing protein
MEGQMKNKTSLSISLIIVVILSISSILLSGFSLTKNKTPNEHYVVYLNGEKIGTVASKQSFNDYINVQEERLKKLYGVDEIYTPNGVEIKKVITYSNKNNTNEEIYNKVRGLNPWPKAFSFLGKKRFVVDFVYKSEKSGNPGEVIEANDDGIVVACGKGSVVIKDIKIEGKKMMPASDFLRGHKIEKGTVLGG